MARTTITQGINFIPFCYRGNGQDDRRIEIGLQPAAIFIKSASTHYAVLWTDTMDAGDTAYLQNTAANFTGGVKSVFNKGFVVGTDNQVNASGTLYHGFAILDDSDSFFKTFSYTGNGVNNRAITVGFESDFVLIRGDNAQMCVFRFGQDTGDTTYRPDSSGSASNKIKTITSTGITIGTHADVNTDTNVYHGIAFNGLAGQIVQNNYTGTGVDGESITGVGFRPDFLFIKRRGASSIGFRTSSMKGDVSGTLSNGALTTNIIQDLEADGFDLGTTANVNTVSEIYNFLAIKKLGVRRLA